MINHLKFGSIAIRKVSELSEAIPTVVGAKASDEQRNARELRIARFLMVSHLAATA